MEYRTYVQLKTKKYGIVTQEKVCHKPVENSRRPKKEKSHMKE